MSEKKFCVDYGKRQAGCKKCKQKIEKGEVRIAKLTANPFSDEADMKNYHHPTCIFQTFEKARATTKIIEDPGDIDGWAEIKEEDKQTIIALIRENNQTKNDVNKTPKKSTPKKADKPTAKKRKLEDSTKSEEKTKKTPISPVEKAAPERPQPSHPHHDENAFKEFQKLCTKISQTPSYNMKTEIMSTFFKPRPETEFKLDLHLWVRLLIPGVVKRIYNMQNKQIIKIFSRIFCTDEDAMLEDLEKGDVAETISLFFTRSKDISPLDKSSLFLHEVDQFLERLSYMTKEEEQQVLLAKVAKRCTAADLKMFVRLMKGDLKIQSGSKHVLEALHPDAHEAFNSSRNIDKVLDRILELRRAGTPEGRLDIGASLMQPVQPMLAAPCKSVEMAFQKCPHGIYSEIKYDGERVQVHKEGAQFKYFSRSLKPVMAHKVKHFKEYIPRAFPTAANLIIDAEVLLVDNRTGKPLPFGSLGVHKGSDFKDADPCLFVFDCLFYNGESLMHRSLEERRRFLVENMIEVGNRIKLSEIKHITKTAELVDMIKEVFHQGLEGLMIKDIKSIYEPGKRHWLKIKKDYLNDGAMADSADLVVLGGWYGSGQKGGLISVFLMGCMDPSTRRWCTVSKVHTGHDDATLDRLQGELMPNMVKIKGDFTQVPGWLKINRNMVPDFVVKDPQDSPVWEITGAEFSKAELHTADGISIRFPRVTRIRDDKNAETATNLLELKELYKTSKLHLDVDLGQQSTSGESKPNSATKAGKQERKRKSSGDESESGPSSTAKAGKSERKRTASGRSEASAVKRIKSDLDLKMEKLSSDGGHSDVSRHRGQSSGRSTNPEAQAGFFLVEKAGDLFGCPGSSSLAHCISKDCRLGKGIAAVFRQRFGRVKEIEECRADIGEIAVLKDGSRYIYNLVTKEKYYGKPTYETLRQSLEKMREHAARHAVRQISLPKIGCGLDGLQWPAVRTLLKNVFQKECVTITVYIPGEQENTGPPSSEGGTPSKLSSPKQTSVKQYFSREGSKLAPGKDVKNTNRPSTGADRQDKEFPRSTSVGFGYKTVHPLPNVFVGLKVFLPAEAADFALLRRNVVALGGKLVDSSDGATHRVYSAGGGLEIAPGCKHVTLKWLEDSIKLERAQPEKYYSVSS